MYGSGVLDMFDKPLSDSVREFTVLPELNVEVDTVLLDVGLKAFVSVPLKPYTIFPVPQKQSNFTWRTS